MGTNRIRPETVGTFGLEEHVSIRELERHFAEGPKSLAVCVATGFGPSPWERRYLVPGIASRDSVLQMPARISSILILARRHFTGR